MVKCIKITSVFFLSLFMWQLVVLFASPLINPELTHSTNSNGVINQIDQSLEMSPDCDLLDYPSTSNQLVEEVLEEEIELSENTIYFSRKELIQFQSYYFVNDYHSVITSDYIPPETTV